MKLNKTLSMLSAVATVSMMGTGCVSQRQSAPVYEGYISADAKNIDFQRQYAAQNGKVLEATYVKDPATGEMVAAYGIRSKTFWEGTKEFCRENADVIRTSHYLIQDSTAVMDSVNGFRQVNATKKVASRVGSLTTAVNNQTKQQNTLFGNIADILEKNQSSCNSN